MKKLGAIILAAGKGKRMNAKTANKVTLLLGNKPMIVRAVSLLEKVGIRQIVVVVGFAKKSVMNLLGDRVIFSEQKKRLGTGHAVSCGLKRVSKNIENVLVINGDDSAFYTEKILKDLIGLHYSYDAAITFLTIEKDNPFGLGRIVRDKNDKLIAIIEEKSATEKQRETREVNPGCYIFKVNFLKKYLKKISKNKITKEYYLTDIVAIGIKNDEKIKTFKAGCLPWRGVNTKEELLEAEQLFTTK